MNAATSNTLRGRLTNKYVGQAGIHGIGVQMHDDQPVIYVYVEMGQPRQALVFDESAAEAKPYEGGVVPENIPTTRARCK